MITWNKKQNSIQQKEKTIVKKKINPKKKKSLSKGKEKGNIQIRILIKG